MHRYCIHGITIASEFLLPELRPTDHSTSDEVVIKCGSTPRHLRSPAICGAFAQAGRGEYLLYVPGVARYHIPNPHRITVEPASGVHEDDVRTFLLSSVMDAIVHARGVLPLHASGIVWNDQCILLAGASGAGKSTLAAYLLSAGLSLVSDDLTAISMSGDGRLRAHPGVGGLRLWKDTVDTVTPLPGTLLPGRAHHDRRFLRVPASLSYADLEPLPIRRIYVLRSRRVDRIMINPLTGTDAMRHVLEQTSRFKLLRGIGNRERHFQIASALAAQTSMYEVDRPFRMDELNTLGTTLHRHFHEEAVSSTRTGSGL